MEPQEILIGFILFSVVFVTGLFTIGDINTTYHLSISTDEFGESYNAINGTYALSNDARDSLQGEQAQDEDRDSLAVKGFNAIGTLQGTFSIFSAIINSIASTLGLPAYLVTAGIAIWTIILVFILVQYIRGFFV